MFQITLFAYATKDLAYISNIQKADTKIVSRTENGSKFEMTRASKNNFAQIGETSPMLCQSACPIRETAQKGRFHSLL